MYRFQKWGSFLVVVNKCKIIVNIISCRRDFYSRVSKLSFASRLHRVNCETYNPRCMLTRVLASNYIHFLILLGSDVFLTCIWAWHWNVFNLKRTLRKREILQQQLYKILTVALWFNQPLSSSMRLSSNQIRRMEWW